MLLLLLPLLLLVGPSITFFLCLPFYKPTDSKIIEKSCKDPPGSIHSEERERGENAHQLMNQLKPLITPLFHYYCYLSSDARAGIRGSSNKFKSTYVKRIILLFECKASTQKLKSGFSYFCIFHYLWVSLPLVAPPPSHGLLLDFYIFEIQEMGKPPELSAAFCWVLGSQIYL